MSPTEDLAIGEVREGYAEIGDQRWHYVESGEGPLIVPLHGFPRLQQPARPGFFRNTVGISGSVHHGGTRLRITHRAAGPISPPNVSQELSNGDSDSR